MTSDENERLENDGHDDAEMKQDEDFFVLDVDGDEDHVGADDGDDDFETTFVLEESDDADADGALDAAAPDAAAPDALVFPDKHDGFEETAESLFDEPSSDADDLFGDIDAATEAAADHVEAATDDVVARVSESGEFELESTDDSEIFAGLGDEDEDTDARWQEEQEHLVDDFVQSDDVDHEPRAHQPGYEPAGYDATQQYVPEETAPLPPPGYRPPVARDPQEYGSIPTSALGQDAGDASGSHHELEHQLLGDSPQESGTWSAMDSGEFDIVQNDGDLASGQFAAVEPPLPHEEIVDEPRPTWAAAPQGEEVYETAAPEEEFDPIYGKPMPTAAEVAGFPGHEAAPQAGVAYDAQAYDHLEEMVHDAHEEAGPQVIGAAPQGNVWLRRFMGVGMAASILVLGLVAFVTLRPDLPLAQKMRGWIGLSTNTSSSSLQVATIARPKVDTTFSVPRLSMDGGVAKTDPIKTDPKTGGGTEVVITDRSRRNFAALRTMTQWAGRAGGDLAVRWLKSRRAATDTKTGPVIAKGPDKGPSTDKTGTGTTDKTGTKPNTPDTRDPITKTGGTGTVADGGKADPRTGGDTNPTGGGKSPATSGTNTESVATGGTKKPSNPPAMSGGPHGWGQGIMRGTQAFAQLQNGHFFVGRVQKVSHDELLMAWGKAEITFVPGDLQKLMPVGANELEILQGGTQGFVKLKNQNKIWGQILEDLPESITIQKGESRIIIPKVAVAQVAKQKKARVRLGRNDQDWSEQSIPRLEDDMPKPTREVEPELQSGAIRVQFDQLKKRSDKLRDRIRKRIPIGNSGRPGR